MYILNFENQPIELPEYNFDIASNLEKAEASNQGSMPFKDKCKTIYNCLAKIVNIEELIGKFDNKIDPNRIQILFSEVVNAYNRPIIEQRIREFSETIENSQIDKIKEMVDVAKEMND